MLPRIGIEHSFFTTDMKDFLIMFPSDCLATYDSHGRYQLYTKDGKPLLKEPSTISNSGKSYFNTVYINRKTA